MTAARRRMSSQFLYVARALLAAGLLLSAPAAAPAQTQFTSLTAFGDSYMDHGINGLALLRGDTAGYPSHGGNPSVLQRTAPVGYVAYPYHLQQLLGLADGQVTNYAIGGATTTATNFSGSQFSLPFELTTWGGRPFGPRDLVLINIGGNDMLGGLAPGANPSAAGAQTGINAAAAVDRFVQAGARTVAVTGFSGMGFLPAVQAGGAGAVTAANMFGAAYHAALQQRMRPLALDGARIFLMDQTLLGTRIAANPGAYGFDSIAYAGSDRVSMFIVDGIHQTSAGYALASRYLANILNAPSTYAAQGDVAQITTTTFVRSITTELDGGRSAGFGMALPGAAAAANPLSLQLGISGATGSRTSRSDALGLRYDALGLQIGAAYRLSPNVSIGALFNYSNGSFDLHQNGGRIHQDAYQFGAYASLSYAHWFADAMAVYSRGDMRVARAGILDTVRGSTSSDSFAAGARAAYLFDIAPWLQAGPLAGLTYLRSRINGYTETGDPVLTFAVGSQSLDILVGSAGIHFRFPLQVNGQSVSPYINLTAEHDVLGGGRTILATLTQSPLLPIATPVAGRGGGIYGALQAGVKAPVGERTSIAVNVATTFARGSGNDFGASFGIEHRF